MSDSEEWRRELAERLHPNTDWTVRPMQRVAPPTAKMIPIQEPQIAPQPGGAATESDAAVPVDCSAATAHPRPVPIVAQAPHMPNARIWTYVAAALSMLAAAASWLFVNRVEETPVAPATAQVAAAPASAAELVRPASLPADDAVRCDATLAAPVLSALMRRGTVFDGQEAHPAATLGAVRQLTADGLTAVCRGVLELQLADARAGSPVLQIVSGPVDYAVDGAAGVSVPTFRVLSARSIFHRLATMPTAVPVAVAAAEPVAVGPPPVSVERHKSIKVALAATSQNPVNLPVRPSVAEPLPPRHIGTETAALPAPAEALPPRRAEVEAAVPHAGDADEIPVVTRPLDERAADSVAAQSIYGAIARSGDPQAMEAADEGRDFYLARSRRCATPACAAVAYKRWLTQLREIDERSRTYTNY